VRKIVDMDEWSQLALLRLMTYYARKCFPRHGQSSEQPGKETSVDHFYGESTDRGSISSVDSDLALLLNGIRPLLQSRNSAVVIAVTRCYVNVGTSEYVRQAVGPLVALLRGAK